MAKKKTVGKLGAGVLAATTVISGLGFGIMPAGAATETKASSTHEYEVGDEGATLQLIAKTPTGYNYFADKFALGTVRSATTLDQAKQDALSLTAHFAETVDGTDYWTLKTDRSSSSPCLRATTVNSQPAAIMNSCNTTDALKWTIEDGALKSQRFISSSPWLVSSLETRSGDTFFELSSQREEASFVDLPTTLAGLSADIQDVDLEAGTALLDGTAPDDATDVEVTYLDKDSKKKTYNAAAKDGKWSQALSALALGNTSVHLKAYNGAELIAESDVDVDLPVTPLSVQPELSEANVEAVAKLTGSASKNTTIKVKSGTKQVATTMTGEDGSFEVPVNAPNAAGDYELTATQEIRDEDATPQDVTIPYGAGVAVSSPENGAELDAGQPLVVSGTAQTNSLIRVYEKGNPRVVLGQATATNGYRIVLNDLEDREYQLVVAGVSKGNNVTTAEVTVNPGKSDVTAPTATVAFDEDDLSAKATVSGTGAAGATITVKDEDGTTLGTTKVSGTSGTGDWSLPIDPIGPGKHALTIEQTGIEGTQTAAAEADFGAAVSLNGPATFTDGTMDVTGTSSKGAQVSITTGGKTVDTFEVTNEDGTFDRTLKGLGAGAIQLTATAKSKGGLTTTDTLSATAPIPAESVQIGSHVKDGTFVPGPQLFTGRGTVGATITLNVHGFSAANAGYNLTTTVDQFGEWEIQRALGDTSYPLFSVKQTAQAGVVNELTNWNLRPYKEIGEPGDLQLTNFKDGDFFNPGDQTFSGKATPGATIRFNPFGLDNPGVAAYDIVTTAHAKTGVWTIRRALANTSYDRIAVRQEPAVDGHVNQVDDIRVAPYGWLGAPADLTVTSPTAGSTAAAGVQTFTGTARPGTTVTVYVWGDNPASPATGVADARGNWRIDRPMGSYTTPYNVRVVQDDADGKVDTVRVPLTITP
ncbi:Ig-like domain-containing protein [Curtobacterium sp. APC 4022]|uniref:Ig-like domain-containing protein n=1 Tax=Curtobacterium sp. APC 4022 TaxID=3035201 RepID=UPI0025B47E11|nr:Ig-like domain-containing protein [Curtobacterium sp. APC 4022]MDN3477801.1 Ig-like domain-containing protein [Curtobacterium sp. APC 4022]